MADDSAAVVPHDVYIYIYMDINLIGLARPHRQAQRGSLLTSLLILSLLSQYATTNIIQLGSFGICEKIT